MNNFVRLTNSTVIFLLYAICLIRLTYCECQHINEEHEVHTLHKPRGYMPSQNHMAMGRRAIVTYKLYTSFICRCVINHPKHYTIQYK